MLFYHITVPIANYAPHTLKAILVSPIYNHVLKSLFGTTSFSHWTAVMPKTHVWITGPSEIDEVFRAYKKCLKAADDINPNQFAVFAKAITTERFHFGSAKG